MWDEKALSLHWLTQREILDITGYLNEKTPAPKILSVLIAWYKVIIKKKNGGNN